MADDEIADDLSRYGAQEEATDSGWHYMGVCLLMYLIENAVLLINTDESKYKEKEQTPKDTAAEAPTDESKSLKKESDPLYWYRVLRYFRFAGGYLPTRMGKDDKETRKFIDTGRMWYSIYWVIRSSISVYLLYDGLKKNWC